MGDLMSNYNANPSIVQRFGKVLAVKQRLKNSRRKNWNQNENLEITL